VPAEDVPPLCGDGGHDAVGEPVRPTVSGSPGEGFQLLAAGGDALAGRRPAFQQLEEHGRAEIAVGNVERCGERCEQVTAESVEGAGNLAVDALEGYIAGPYLRSDRPLPSARTDAGPGVIVRTPLASGCLNPSRPTP
jgi:hypothetical protein